MADKLYFNVIQPCQTCHSFPHFAFQRNLFCHSHSCYFSGYVDSVKAAAGFHAGWKPGRARVTPSGNSSSRSPCTHHCCTGRIQFSSGIKCSGTKQSRYRKSSDWAGLSWTISVGLFHTMRLLLPITSSQRLGKPCCDTTAAVPLLPKPCLL